MPHEIYEQHRYTMPSASAEGLIPHGFLDKLYNKAIALNETTRPAKKEYFDNEFWLLSQTVFGASGVRATMGLGYPFYATTAGSRADIIPVPEISRYINEERENIRLDQSLRIGGWICAACQEERQLPDLKTLCKPCDLTKLKPRSPFKVLPDLDMWVITDDTKEETQEIIADNLDQEGFQTSDVNIRESLLATSKVLNHLVGFRGVLPMQPSIHLPVDIHTITRSEFLNSLHRFMRNPSDEHPIYPDSLRVGWHTENKPVDFAFDFVFSLTEMQHDDPELMAEIHKARSHFAGWLATENRDVTDYLVERNERVGRILDTEVLRSIARQRVQGWERV